MLIRSEDAATGSVASGDTCRDGWRAKADRTSGPGPPTDEEAGTVDETYLDRIGQHVRWTSAPGEQGRRTRERRGSSPGGRGMLAHRRALGELLSVWTRRLAERDAGKGVQDGHIGAGDVGQSFH